MMKRLRKGSLAGLAGGLLLTAAPAAAQDGAALLEANCAGCHEADASGALSRVAGQRKTPEGWLMTIVRMRLFHGMPIEADAQAQLVRYLADTQGLAPSEAAEFRYALEREPNTVEAAEAPLGEMCARCHTLARVGLQRRTQEEWNLHVDFHVGQWPTLEYQALARDREWLKLAREEVVPLLAERYPFETDAWTAWQEAAKPTALGDWTFVTRLPGKGEAYGTLTVSGDAQPYAVAGTLKTAAGEELAVSGRLNLYTGYEWRANLTVGDTLYRQVLALAEDGATVAGRQFLHAEDSLGAPFRAVRAGGAPAIAGVVPSTLVAGSPATVQVVGTGLESASLSGTLQASGGTANAFGIALDVSPAAGADGPVAVASGPATADAALAVYSRIDSLRVEPAYAVARVGGGGGSAGKVPARFEAIGYWNGPDGEPGTDDDVRIGAVPASWSVEPFNEEAETLKDVEHAGAMDETSGIFMPAVAGPNPDRPFSTNNAGNLKVLARSGEAAGEAQLIVTVQRWNDPPIR
ncbi:quinohemoprotein amine dehydrogenase subunit alpha [Polymorphum gilvum]|uniref:Quinohemoprotein amine dehydrogenase, alpha subunit n=1 Tax=Polymorphum gilvum (strain LMG 25793 / CGMCC 1.9160 / SL003B-26A1) TaxID=991905 RepID=F2J2J9_POLGS|nr:quinohemoprotein amine dehydrogenase subunit alpha [Polymorphum gilvum]ADZ70913.1 Quinohemoprotein amine dehydrogenase, alpha subunit [Polymorphum gilvum SL003B-26A1]